MLAINMENVLILMVYYYEYFEYMIINI